MTAIARRRRAGTRDDLRHSRLGARLDGLVLPAVPTSARVQPPRHQQLPATAPARAQAVLDTYCVTLPQPAAAHRRAGARQPRRRQAGRQRRRLGARDREAARRLDAAARTAAARCGHLSTRWRAGSRPRSIARGRPARIRAGPARSIASIAREYNNAVRDLFALDLDVKPLLPGDETADGSFDNFADVLIDLDRASGALSVGGAPGHAARDRPAAGAPRRSQTFEIPLHVLQDDRQSEDLPFGSRGGIAIRYTLSGRRRISRSRSGCAGSIRTTSWAWAGRSSSMSGSTASC